MGGDSNRTFKAGVWLERGLEFGTWKGFKGILKDAACWLLSPLLSHAVYICSVAVTAVYSWGPLRR